MLSRFKRNGGAAISVGPGHEPNRRSFLASALRRYNVHLLYGASAIGYITLGIFVPQALSLWPEGAAFLLLTVWVLPALVSRLWRLF